MIQAPSLQYSKARGGYEVCNGNTAHGSDEF